MFKGFYGFKIQKSYKFNKTSDQALNLMLIITYISCIRIFMPLIIIFNDLFFIESNSHLAVNDLMVSKQKIYGSRADARFAPSQ